MKKLLGKRWHRIPVVIVSVILALALMAGGVFATNGLPFFTSTLSVQVNEALAVGAFDTWDNLHPYGSDVNAVWEDEGGDHSGTGILGDVRVSLGGTPEHPIISVTVAAETPRTGEGFVAGEWIVIPLNIRNGSSEALTLSASAPSDGLDLWASFEVNNSVQTDPIPAGHEGEYLAYGFKAEGDFATLLSEWSTTVDGNSGFSGSAVHNAQVLFIKIEVPGDAEPGIHTLEITFNRS